MKADPQTEREILELIQRRIAAFTSGDLDAEMELWAPDPDVTAIATGPEAFRYGPAEVRAQRARLLHQSEGRKTRFTRQSVSARGDVAWFTGEGELWARVDGEDLNYPLRVTAVLVRYDGRWRMVQQHSSTPALTQREGEAYARPVETLAVALEHERPDLRPQASPEGVVTLLFSDIEDSTTLNDDVGDLRWIDLLRSHNEIVRERLAAHGGTEVKTIGDAFMVAFSSARRAVLCAIDLQRAFAAYNREHDEAPLRIRIGLHAGEPVREGGDFYGKSVTLASRIADQARGGEILVSSLLKELAESAGDIEFGEQRDADLKGFAEPQRVFAVQWGGA